jgi:hypothetical protein
MIPRKFTFPNFFTYTDRVEWIIFSHSEELHQFQCQLLI